MPVLSSLGKLEYGRISYMSMCTMQNFPRYFTLHILNHESTVIERLRLTLVTSFTSYRSQYPVLLYYHVCIYYF